MISVVLGEYKISFFSPFRKTSFGWNGGHIVGLDIVSFLAIRRMQTRITANTMGITISKTVTHTFLFWRSQFFHKSKINCLPRPAILKAANAYCLSVLLFSTLFTVNEEKNHDNWWMNDIHLQKSIVHIVLHWERIINDRTKQHTEQKIQCALYNNWVNMFNGVFPSEKNMYHWWYTM